MNLAERYLAKHGSGKRFILRPPDANLKFAVVIPAFNEDRLTECLESIRQCDLPYPGIEVITVINWPEKSDHFTIQKNRDILSMAMNWGKNADRKGLEFHFMLAEPQGKGFSGVGYARKTGMDEAIARLNECGQDNGILISLDADARVDHNYFTAIEKHFHDNPSADGCSIYFEHPITGNLQNEAYEAVAGYELHMRYYLQGLRYAGHPNAFHTVGSAFAVRAEAYCKQGGMNRRHAGEDFYFLQKIFDLGNFSECNTTRVIPSARPSQRVPFGTGPAIHKYIEEGKPVLTNNPELFLILKDFLSQSFEKFPTSGKINPDIFQQLHPLMQEFLLDKKFDAILEEIKENSSSPEAFHKRFFRWFNMFMALKYMNFGKKQYPDLPVSIAARWLLEKVYPTQGLPDSESGLLEKYRWIQGKQRA